MRLRHAAWSSLMIKEVLLICQLNYLNTNRHQCPPLHAVECVVTRDAVIQLYLSMLEPAGLEMTTPCPCINLNTVCHCIIPWLYLKFAPCLSRKGNCGTLIWYSAEIFFWSRLIKPEFWLIHPMRILEGMTFTLVKVWLLFSTDLPACIPEAIY